MTPPMRACTDVRRKSWDRKDERDWLVVVIILCCDVSGAGWGWWTWNPLRCERVDMPGVVDEKKRRKKRENKFTQARIQI